MATNQNVGSAYLTIIPSARGFVRALKKELAGEGFDKYGALLGKQLEQGFHRSQVVNKIKTSFRKMFTGVAALGKSGLLDMFIAVGIAGISALAPLAGLLVGLPALAVAAAAGLGAMLLAFKGVGTVLQSALIGDLEAFEAGLDELTESAGKVVSEIGRPFLDLHNIAQEAFFAPMVADALGFAAVMEGPVQRSIKAVAAGLGTAAAGLIAWAKSSDGAAVIERSAQQTALFFERAGAGIPALMQGILDLASVTVGDLGTGIGRVTKQFGEWLSQIAADGSAQRWFNDAIDLAKQLWEIAGNLGRTLAAVFKAAGADGGTLQVLMDATAAMAAWAESAEGQETLNSVFQTLGTVLAEVARAIGIVALAFADLAEWFNSLNPETQEAIAQFIAWSIVLAPFAGRLVALIGIIRGVFGVTNTLISVLYRGIAGLALFTRGLFGGAAGLTAKSGAAARAGAAVNGFIASVGRGIAAVGRFIGRLALGAAAMIRYGATVAAVGVRMAAASVASAARVAFAWTVTMAQAFARGAAAMARSAATMILVGLRLAASAVASAARVAAAWAVMAAKAVASGAKQVGALLLSGAKWVWLGIVAMANALRVAASWFIAMGPIGWIILALIAIIAIVVIFWDEIKAAFLAFGNWLWGYIEPFWNQIVELFSTAFNWIKEVLNWDELVALIQDFGARFMEIWNGFWSIVTETLSAIWDLIVGIVTGNTDKARNAIGRLADIPGKFAAWFSGAYNSVKEWLGKALSYITELPGRILDALGDLGSLLYNAGKDLIDGLLNGIRNSFGTVQDLLGDLTSQLPDWKGPENLDKIILEPNGEMVVGGFLKGVKNAVPALRAYLQNLTAELPLMVGSGIDAAQAPPAGDRGITIENFNPQAADNRFTADQLWSQAKMVYS